MSSTSTAPQLDAVVIGAGFSGLYLLHKLRNEMGLSVRVFEAGSDIGGTWFWNRYPGARCDSESYVYCYSFDEKMWQEWEWSERYPQQAEVLTYFDHVAERFDLRRDITFNSRVLAATLDEAANTWTVRTDTGEEITARYLITGVGCLSAWNTPPFPGLETFTGQTYFTGLWPHEPVDLTGKRVGLIGTGASGVQTMPRIAEVAADLTVFQRTPNYIIPARHGKVPPELTAERKRDFAGVWERTRNGAFGLPFQPEPKPLFESTDAEVEAVLEKWWETGGLGFLLGSYLEPIFSVEANQRISAFLDRKIREKVNDPAVADLLTPKKLTYAVKRPPLDSGFYEAFNEPHVHLVDVGSNPIAAVTPDGLRLTDGTEYAVDVLVFATGFDATTGTLNRIDIRGREGQLLREKWAGGPRTYLGLMSAGYPNLFMITGPQSPGVLSNMPVSIEQHVEFVSAIIGTAAERGAEIVEAAPEAEDAWVVHNEEAANATLFPLADTTYTGANIAGKVRAFLPNIDTVPGYRARCEEVAANGYEGFVFTPASATAPA
ncbi:NAD(P)/FAD-dependent oxidoreductase [Sporichthya sp.]|uniref:flavin-containing monooxygenase n=1 Tax=Sporichthya sp. TaxID=65475 RepID=UPI00182EFEC1|nr:NAD(P)/FAD-dependent oxidoreductase [Sporichthya sp.]MBA3744393.1 NAD(P)/FAD-dependent oxidoreductase [Sporichthya sp.]